MKKSIRKQDKETMRMNSIKSSRKAKSYKLSEKESRSLIREYLY